MWLSGCSGCHMSFLDQDELLIELAKKIQLVYSPIVDVKVFPENVDVTLIEGAVANDEQEKLLKEARERTVTLISLGDCAITGNVTALRNILKDSDKAVLEMAFIDTSEVNPQVPTDVPKLLKKVRPLHEVVKVDHFIPGCPPPADLITYVLTELMHGRVPNMEGRSRYG
ncbi:TPA: oxidoreductase [Candidatus Bathyarchaeota archaeon]|nr:oxidoreductase [Candidatus Bathyarchaeota archaeon]HIJ08480.1 oxidoreductase [Candidatus Bathyarchaeota archaeon]